MGTKKSEKDRLRKKLKSLRDIFSSEEKIQMNQEICKNIKLLPQWEQAEVVYTYVSFGSEADTITLIKEALYTGKWVAVPKVLGKGIMEFYYILSLEDLKPGIWGILEPEGKEEQKAEVSSLQSKPFMILPGLGFDREFHRLGYGGGFYDRYLEKYGKENFFKVAIAFSQQIVEEVPCEEQDVLMNMIVTEERVRTKKAL